jgi:predicted aspartyl protease
MQRRDRQSTDADGVARNGPRRGIAVRGATRHYILMGMVHVAVEVSASGEAGREVECLVDSGAVYSVLPPEVWSPLGLAPLRRVRFSLGDGSIIERNVGNAFFRYRGVLAPSPVVLGEPGDSALLGTVTLGAMGLVLDPFARELRPAHLRLGALAATFAT